MLRLVIKKFHTIHSLKFCGVMEVTSILIAASTLDTYIHTYARSMTPFILSLFSESTHCKFISFHVEYRDHKLSMGIHTNPFPLCESYGYCTNSYICPSVYMGSISNCFATNIFYVPYLQYFHARVLQLG